MVRARRLVNDLATPRDSVRKLQRALYVKAKTEPDCRFYSLWDKCYRPDVLAAAYNRCRRNSGSAGIDGETFAMIEQAGRDRWLAQLQQELQSGDYRPQPLRRVWIPKANGKFRPLAIPCIRDRVVQMAVTLVLQPIFEPDFQPQQYGFRPRLDAKMAVRRVYFHLTERRRTEVVDADLKDYFNTIPHGALVKSLARRIADGSLLRLIGQWLRLPVVEPTDAGSVVDTSAKRQHRGVPQGSPCSPLLSTIYFRRFLLAWERHNKRLGLDAGIVNYADDLVICCRPGHGQRAMAAMTTLMERLGLTVNAEKTALVVWPATPFDFLGYTFCRQYTHQGRAYLGTRPSKTAEKRLRQAIHEETAINRTWREPTRVVGDLNAKIGGWANYFDQGPVLKSYERIQRYTERRLRRWLVKKHKQRGTTGYRRYPDKYLHEGLGLIKLPTRRADLSSAKT